MRLSLLHRRGLVALLAAALALGTTATASAGGVTPSKASPVQREQAQSRFVKGRELYLAKKYEAALVELTASLDIISSPNTRLFIARCLRELGRTVPAYVELGRAAVEAKELLRDDTRYEKTKEAALEERTALEPKLGFLQLTIAHATDTTTLKVATEDVRRGGWDEPVPVAPGMVEVSVETPGHPPIKQELQIGAGERKAVAVDAMPDGGTPTVAATDPAPDSGSSFQATTLRPYAYVAAGVAVVGLGTFIVAGAMANGTYSKLETACGSSPCPPGYDSDISAGKTQQTFANVGLVVLGVAAAASVTLFIVSAPKTASSPSAAAARVSVGPSFVGLRGDF